MNLKQIAQEAGLSLSTVSLVLNGKPGVSQSTRDRVTQLLIQNGYNIRSSQAKEKALSVPRRLLFIHYRGSGCLMESKDSFFIQILDGIEQQARRSNFSLQILNLNQSNLKEELITASRNVDGVIIFATELEAELVPILHYCNVPLVVIDANFPHEQFNYITVENKDAVFRAISYLHSLGHTQIGYLHSFESTGSIPDRERGYYSSMKELGLPINPDHVFQLYLFADRTYDQMCRILSAHPSLPTAFVSDNDVLAIGAMRAFQDCGYRIPEDISIIGFDDSYISSISNPPLTTVHSPQPALGRAAVNRIQEILDTGDVNIIRSSLFASLVIRNSTAPPRPTND
ncbi:MAG: LacI family DNA-binding transcriptional regulator [Eubacteriales bacterium]|nr:LacI family DNA-binding transcriptional regulator [Eubacteriales bacterium]